MKEGFWTPKVAETRADSAFFLGARRASSARQATRACPNVAMWVHLAIDGTRSSQLTSLCPMRNVAYDTVKLLAAMKEVFGHTKKKKGQPGTHLRLSPLEMRFAHSLQGKHQGRARPPTGRHAPSPTGIGRRPNPQRSLLRCKQRTARKLKRVSEKQHKLHGVGDKGEKWRPTLPAAPRKKIQVTETCTRRCERKR